MRSESQGNFVWLTALIAATLFWAAGSSVAQQPGGAMSQPNQQQTMPGQQMPGQQTPGETAPNSPGMPGAPGNSGGDSTPQTYVDQSFLHNTFESNLAQVKMGQLAAQKSQSDDVKQFGQKMVQIHTQLDNQLEPVAKHLGVNQPKSPSKKDKQEIAKLEALSGPQFDAAFIQVMTKDQQSNLKDFNTEEKDGRDPTAQKAAQLDEPVLQQHLQVLEKLAQAHNVPVETSEVKK
jgi:putative membrane protein